GCFKKLIILDLEHSKNRRCLQFSKIRRISLYITGMSYQHKKEIAKGQKQKYQSKTKKTN
ncbi:hypothetical protein, partial [Bartonella sp. AA81SXKL]|uniref:hypothetical protein n=1 Tax=Bartonella sp. AA81SXKL TaxID=3243438 RepID=UPI0035CEC56E